MLGKHLVSLTAILRDFDETPTSGQDTSPHWPVNIRPAPSLSHCESFMSGNPAE